MTGETLTCGNIAIRIDESSRFGIIVAAVEVVQARFGVVDIATVAEGVILAQRAGGVGVLRLTEDIADVVVGVDPCPVRRLIVLAGQLIEAVIGVRGSIRAVNIVVISTTALKSSGADILFC